MKIRDRVCSQKIGLPFTGRIIGLFDPYFFLAQMGTVESVWINTYPDWKNNLVAQVLLDQPMFSMSMEEYINQGGNENFYNYLTPTNRLYHPACDLVLIEDLLKVKHEYIRQGNE